VCVSVYGGVRACVQSAESELSQLEMDEVEMEQLRRELAEYLCDDVQTFQLDDCIRTVNTFIQQFIAAADVRILADQSARRTHVTCWNDLGN